MVTTHQRMLQLLILAYRNQYRAKINGHELPQGCLPLYEFQGPNYGGSAANVRMTELKRPEGDAGGKGIPIEKIAIDKAADGTKIRKTVCYKLAVDPIYIDLSASNCRLDRALLKRDGLTCEDYIDDSFGNPSRACRIVKTNPRERLGQSNLFTHV